MPNKQKKTPRRAVKKKAAKKSRTKTDRKLFTASQGEDVDDDGFPAIPAKRERKLSLHLNNGYPANIRLFAGSAHHGLSEKIAAHLKQPLQDTILGKFSNGETRVEIKASCRGSDAFIIQPICTPEDSKSSVNDMFLELLILVSALRGASAQRITVVMPIYGYARQDKKDKSRSAITGRLVADLLQASGIDRAMTVDLHASQIQGFFSEHIPVDNLYAEDILTAHLIQYVKSLGVSADDVVIVSPDAGGAKRASRVATKLGTDCAIISKERLKANEVSSMRLVGTVSGKVAILVDDMADTCGTLVLAAKTLKENGASRVAAYVVHGVLSGPALQRLNDCEDLEMLVATNTLPQDRNQAICSKLQVVDISALLADAIKRTHTNVSISALFEDPLKK